ncbi:hypothetical protein GCM10007043_20290 [Calditerricola satsumensis]|uniref:D-Lysine 5,6-aminomutase alpha subunit domain-containing protein n=1 Tax=Calditerricola satsumensis TaxID=373054 RepID=A0A8J3FFS1_9BACI|nr:lysine 5,6-aminomutase subunit alpha [Calditerricola satsumensis]GGK06209.1 hypothetical protein GCM10007043_20290 [Calditerricola satsumensis]
MDKLRLDPAMIDRARDAARGIAEEVDRFTAQRTTVATERTVLRLMGVDGVNADGVPLPNVVVDHVHERGLLGRGGWPTGWPRPSRATA